MRSPRRATPVATRTSAEQPSLHPTDDVAIERTVRDYVDGWYDGNAERMARALHPDLAKRAALLQPNGQFLLDLTSANEMIELTRAGVGKQKARPGQGNTVLVLDVSGDIASAKSVSPDYIDLLHLVKLHGKWRILNVLWAPRPEARIKAEAP